MSDREDELIEKLCRKIRDRGDVEEFKEDPEGYLERMAEKQKRIRGEGGALTVSDVAEVLDVNERTVQRKLRSGELPGAKIGGYWRISRADLNDWWREQGGGDLFKDGGRNE